MKQSVLVLATVYNKNKSLNLPAVTKQEFLKYQAEQNPKYRNGIALKGKKQTDFCQSRIFSRQNIVLSLYQALKFENFFIVWCGNWSLTIRLCSTTASYKRRRFRQIVYFTWRCWHLSESGFESKCQRQRKRKLSPSQDINVRGWTTENTRWCCLWICTQFGES